MYGIVQTIHNSWRQKMINVKGHFLINYDENIGYNISGEFYTLRTVKSSIIYQQFSRKNNATPKYIDIFKNKYGLDIPSFRESGFSI